MKKVIALYDMKTGDGLKWTGGLDYELEENEEDFGITADNGQLCLTNRFKEVVMRGFEEAKKMKPEEAIEDIRLTVQPCVGGKSLELAIKALEKQIPKKPLEGATFKHIGKCPDCRQIISTRSAFRNCQYCGQAINWEVEE